MAADSWDHPVWGAQGLLALVLCIDTVFMILSLCNSNPGHPADWSAMEGWRWVLSLSLSPGFGNGISFLLCMREGEPVHGLELRR
jgi:hypothetical protein